jgi:hypothetical protein
VNREEVTTKLKRGLKLSGYATVMLAAFVAGYSSVQTVSGTSPDRCFACGPP